MKSNFLRRTILTILVSAICITGVFFGIHQHKNSVNASASAFDTEYPAAVKRVVDGDTIIVCQNKKDFKIRLIGINTPESVSSNKEENTEEGKVASDYTKKQLPKGIEVYLEFDEEKTDKYGRTLAYVWLTDDCDYNNYTDFCRYNYGALLLQNTYCEAAYYKPNGKYRVWYEQLEDFYQTNPKK